MVDAAGVERASVETGHQRSLTTVFGEVGVTRQAYRKHGEASLHPADGRLNLPREEYSHGLRKQVAVEIARDSYEEVVAAIEPAFRTSGRGFSSPTLGFRRSRLRGRRGARGAVAGGW